MNYEGEIRDINLVERLIQLWRDRFTGAIRFENDGIIKIVYFKEGDILSASTNDRADSVDEILMRAGKVSKEHVKQALAKRKENETLGDALLNLGFITRKELSWGRRIQVINVIRSIEGWEAGSFTVVADYLPKREEGTIFPLPQLVVEMIVTDQDRGRFERALESGSVVFEKKPDQEETFRKLGLNEDAEAVMAEVDGERSATEIAAASRQETFNAFKLLHALSLLGILQRKEGEAVTAVPMSSLGFETEGVADAADVWGGGGDAAPQFTLGDEPTGAFSSSDDIAPLPGLADPAAADEPVAERPMPAWDESPRGAAPLSAPAPEPPAEPEEERRWGFDEAQIEASQQAIEVPPPVIAPPLPPPPPPAAPRPRTTAPAGEGTMTRRSKLPPPAKPEKRAPRYGLLVAIMAVFILAAAGFFGFTWWQGREPGDAPAVVATAAPAPQPTATATVAPPPVTTTTAAPRPVMKQPPQPQPRPAPPVTAPPAGGGERARYEAMARQYAANPGAAFTVQFAIVCEPSNVTQALRGNGASEVWFIPITLKERFCFRMFWGRFGTREEAERGLAQIPGELRESRPAVVSVPR